jgi:putative pyruvate formate lyase activating enzyme
MTNNLECCKICPRECGINRTNGNYGFCKASDKIKVARAALHYWEEPCISGESGSGTVFFSGCNMGCVFCQNERISHGKIGKEIDIGRLVDIFFELKEKGANNINLVTPTHYLPQIEAAIIKANTNHLNLPFVYNTSSYEKVESIHRLEGLIDIYLPDLKYNNPLLSKKYSNAPDYFKYASNAIKEMVKQIPHPIFNNNGMMQKGVIVRHLLLPEYLYDSKQIVKYLYETYGNQIYISLMSQYTPMPRIKNYPELARKVTTEEYDELVDYAIELGVENGFIQEGETASESFIPDFSCEGV